MGGFSNRPNTRNALGFTRGSSEPFPQIDGQAIKEFIGDFSSSIKYWKAIQCPCVNPTSGQPNISCNQCRGLGWAYLGSEEAPEYQRAQVHSRRSSKQSEKGGMLTTGYASITLFPGVIPGEGDLIQVCKDREVVNEEYHVLGSSLTDGSSAETFRFRDVICVEMVVVQNAVNKLITVVDQGSYEFSPEGRKINFKIPLPAGTKYSVRYQAVPEYIVRAETAKPLLRVTHDDNYADPYNTTKDIVYPFNVQAVRLDRAIVQRQRGAIDFTTPSTFNNESGRGPFR